MISNNTLFIIQQYILCCHWPRIPNTIHLMLPLTTHTQHNTYHVDIDRAYPTQYILCCHWPRIPNTIHLMLPLTAHTQHNTNHETLNVSTSHMWCTDFIRISNRWSPLPRRIERDCNERKLNSAWEFGFTWKSVIVDMSNFKDKQVLKFNSLTKITK